MIDVLVIGAGPVGLTAANELLRGGARVRIVDGAPAIREISKALIWHVRTQEALARVGVLERGAAIARPLETVVMRAYGKRIGAWTFADIDSPFPKALIVGQNRTQHLLADLLAERGGEIEWNTEAVALETSVEDGVGITLRRADGTHEEVRAGYVIGCEGSDSIVRKSLGLTFTGDRYTGEQFIQADCTIRWSLPAGRSYLFLTEVGYLMVIEMPDGLVRIFISLPDTSVHDDAATMGAVEDRTSEPALDEIREHLVRLTGLDAELADAVWRARYRTSHRYANAFRSGRCFLAGDAGHVHVPIGGQGMNTGIQDAFNLGWKLAGVVTGRYDEAILDTYDAERHPVAASLIRGTDRSYRGILHPSELQQRAVRAFGPYVMRTHTAQHEVATVLEELSIAYASSPLNEDHGGAHGPAPGERARVKPVAVRVPDLATVRLDDVTREQRWTLLLFTGTHPAREDRAPVIDGGLLERYGDLLAQRIVSIDPMPGLPDGSLIDAEAELHEAYGVTRPAYVLLRPDAVIAMRGPGSGADEVERYLARWTTARVPTAAR